MKHTLISINDAAGANGYDVYVGKGVLQNIATLCNFDAYTGIFFLTDEYTKSLLDAIMPSFKGKAKVMTVPAGDDNKNIETVQVIWEYLLKNGCDRKSLVVNLGGGVIGDMGGFAASTFMRGIDFVQVPTTTLAQVDASVGGKTGINFQGVKNSIGAIKQPVAVLIDIETLRSLPDRPFIAGFGEIIKHGLIADAEYFKQVTAKKPREYTEDELVDIIAKSVEIKKNIVEADLGEHGQRKLVNLGHTIGHAIESLSHSTENPLQHGEAVSIGIVAEAQISYRMGILSKQDLLAVEQAMQHAGLPTKYKVEDKQAVFQKMLADKKNIGGKIKWTLLTHIGKAIYDQEAPKELVEEVLQDMSS